MSPYLVTEKSEWAHMSKHERAWAKMLNPLILTGLTSKFPILVLQMLIGHHETLFGDKKRASEHTWASMSKHEQAWARMLNPLVLTGLTSKFPSLVLHMLIWHHKTLFGDIKVQVSKHEQAWARMLSPLILTGLTPKFPILVLHMLIWYRKTLFGDKVQVSTNEQAIFELKSALLSF